MNIEHLKLFVSVVERESISLVSQINNISQSALSQQIQNLERHYNTKLLVRSHKGVVTTAAGKIVYQQALKIIDNYLQIDINLQALSKQCKHVKVVATPIACSYALPCSFFCFKQSHPDCNLEMESAQSDIVEERILSGCADIGVIASPTNDKRLKCQSIFSDEFILVASSNFKIPATITKQQLVNYPILTLTKAHRTQQILDKQLSASGIDCNQLNVPYTLYSTESLKLSALNGYGLAFLPYMAIKKELFHKQLRAIKCDELKLFTTYYSVTRKDRRGDDSEFIVDYLEKMLAETIC